MKHFDDYLMSFLDSPVNVLLAAAVVGLLVALAVYFNRVAFYLKFIAKSLRRNLLRSSLTALATLVLVLVITLVWTVIYFLDLVTSEKTKDLKAIVTERWQIPSQMPLAYEAGLARGGARKPEDVTPDDSMTWQFYGGTTDPKNRTRENTVFFFGMQPGKLIGLAPLPSEELAQFQRLTRERARLEGRAGRKAPGAAKALADWDANPRKGGRLGELSARRERNERELRERSDPVVEAFVRMQAPDAEGLLRLAEERGLPGFIARECTYVSMMDGIDEFSEREQLGLYLACRVMERDRRKVVMGEKILAQLNKKVGEKLNVSSLNYPGIDLEVQIIAAFPKGRYDLSSLLNRDYLLDGMDAYKRQTGKEHPMARKTLNLVWLRVPDTEAFRQVAEQIMASPEFTEPAVKAETASSGIASFLDAYRDLVWGMRWLLVPAVMVTMALVIANAISISVRERRTEMAVLKVLGFRPGQILVLVLGEAVLIGAASGFVSSAGAYLVVNKLVGGVPFPIAFFPAFRLPLAALWWGPAIGGLTALLGSAVPAWSARSVKVSEVFAKIA